MQIKRILITHGAPANGKSSYSLLEEQYGVEVLYHSFLEVRGISVMEFRKQGVNPLDYTAIIFTNKHAVDHFFRICKEMRIEMPATTRYFCLTQQIGMYLQKYIQVRKRKLYAVDRDVKALLRYIDKYKQERFLYPCSEEGRRDIVSHLEKKKYHYRLVQVYRMEPVPLDKEKDYKGVDLVCFFAPATVDAFMEVADDSLKKVPVAVYGESTKERALAHGLEVVLEVKPSKGIVNMAQLLEDYIKKGRK